MNLKEYLYTTHSRRTRQVPPIRLKKFDRNYIPELLAKFDMTKGAEIGVAAGEFSEIFCKTIPNCQLLCVDAWGLSNDKQTKEVGSSITRKRYKRAKRVLTSLGCKVVRAMSMDAVKDIPLESLDFVYIDACHEFDYVMEDIIEWARRVKKGGLVAGHDYYRFRHGGVIEAVDAYIKCHRVSDCFLTNEMSPSWFFCK